MFPALECHSQNLAAVARQVWAYPLALTLSLFFFTRILVEGSTYSLAI